jgi:rhamnulokinase
MKTLNLAAVDLGASSGRVMRARFDGRRLSLEEAHRFPNGPVRVLDSLHWDVLRLFAEIKHGLALCARPAGLDGIGLDTWGLDFGLLDRDDRLIGNPFHYRDPRTDGVPARAFKLVPREVIFEHTGIQFMQINTLYQLLAMTQAGAAALDAAHSLLLIPDLFNFWLSGHKAVEFTNVTTTQMYDQRAGDWAWPLLRRLNLPTHILPPVAPPATLLGPLLPAVAEEIGIAGGVPVIAPACHDTAAAVAAVPAASGRYAYISSGTWSLVGVELDRPVITPQSLAGNFTNEGGVAGTVRLLKNVSGLWLLQECRRVWAERGDAPTYTGLLTAAQAAEPFAALVDPDDPSFLHPADMPAAIGEYCVRAGQPAPRTPAAVARCIFESLALKYRWVIEKLEGLLDHRLETIHIVGGGAQNTLLCQLTADATGRPVIAGPVEAAALGNALVQAMALGELASLAEARRLIRESFELQRYEPRPEAGWDEAYEKLEGLIRVGAASIGQALNAAG